jgi:hypothetical protein
MDANGQLTFTRASSATRVASNGLIEKVRTNLVLQSQTFDNASWSKTNTTVTANAETAPDGTLTAETMTIVDSNSRITQSVSLGAGTYTISAYVKVLSTTTAGQLRFAPVVDGPTLSEFFTATSEWQRYTYTFTAVTSVSLVALRGVSSGFVGTIAIWGFQAEVSDFGATDYIPTTTTAVSVGPVSGLPRLDYLNSSCPRLLLEPQRTNPLTFSEQFDNAGWTKTNVTLTSTLGGPIDQSKYFTITCNGTAGTFKGVGKTFFNASPNTYSLSVFAKAGNSSTFVVSSRATLITNDVRAIFNLSNGTITSTNGGTAAIVPYGDGWYRCSFTVVNAGTFTDQASIFFGHPFGAADGATVLATGAMSEIGAYPSSYLNTLSTSVTRVADAAQKTSISSLLGQTEGVVYLETGDIQNNGSTGVEVWYFEMRKDQNNSFGIASGGGTPQPIRFVTKIAGTPVTEGEPAPLANSKIAIKYTSTQFKVFRNGSLVLTTNKNIGGYVDIQFMESASFNLLMILKQFLIFPTALTDAECITLTT